MTALAESPVLDQPAPKRRRWLFVAVGAAVVIAGGVLFATRSAGAPASLDAKFLYVRDGRYQAWLSMDGKHDGKIISTDGTTFVGGCVNGQARSEGNYTGLKFQPATVTPAYLPDVPTTEPALLSYIEQNGGDTNGAGKEIDALAEFS